MDKKKKILDAAMFEFAEYGYEHASTNRMVEKAGIGKGMLFYYFGSKQELFDYVIDYAIDVLDREYVRKLDYGEPDFISRYTKMAQAKLEAYTKFPLVFVLLGSLYLKGSQGDGDEAMARLKMMQESGMAKLFDNVDTALFRDDVDQEYVFKLIRWTIDGYQNELIMQLKDTQLAELDWNSYMNQFYEFLDVLRHILYK